MRPIKLALIRGRYVEDGGAERFVARVLDALKSERATLTLFTREWRGHADTEVVICNPFHLGRLWRDWSFARSVCRELGKRPFDLVQSHERLSCCDVYRAGDGVHREWLGQRARMQGRLGRLATALAPYHCYVKAAEKRLFGSPRLKAVICNSLMVRDEIRHHFGVPETKLHVIYNGVDRNVFRPDVRRHRAEVRARYGVPEHAVAFLFVGSGFERKGVMTTLYALSRLPEPACLWVVGRDRKLKRYQRRAEQLGLAGRVYFVGAQTDVLPFYGAADALVLPTLYDPFPNVIPEAMACGLPVITSTKSGAAELIDPGRDGLVCDALDVTALSEHMQRMLVPQERATLAAGALAKSPRFDLGEMSARFRELYQRIMEQAGRPA